MINPSDVNAINYKTKTANEKEIYSHLMECDERFVLLLSKRVNIAEYSGKLFKDSITFEAWLNTRLIGLVAAYFNNVTGYITDVSVIEDYTKLGIATKLMNMCVEYAKSKQFSEIKLEVNKDNAGALRLYDKFGFVHYDTKSDHLLMRLNGI